MPGISGIAWVRSDTYLAVHDSKVRHADKPRLGYIVIDKISETLRYQELAFPKSASSLSNDLESVCRLPTHENEFLLSESGYWNRDYGRVFHVAINGNNVALKRELKLPLIRDNNENQLDGDQFEGIACVRSGSDTILVILGERGGTSVYPAGILRWGTYALSTGQIDWSTGSITVRAPNPWHDVALRSITGLSVDDKQRLWASAASDAGDLGPFRSLLYLVGTLTNNPHHPIELANEPQMRLVEGFKVEGISAGSENVRFSFGTEDENLGGAWRSLADN